MTHWREAQHNVKIISCSRDEEIVQILSSWWTTRLFFFHDANKTLSDIIDLVLGEQICHFTRTQQIVEIFQESLFFDLVVGKNESHAFTLLTGDTVNQFQIIHQIACTIASKLKHHGMKIIDIQVYTHPVSFEDCTGI